LFQKILVIQNKRIEAVAAINKYPSRKRAEADGIRGTMYLTVAKHAYVHSNHAAAGIDELKIVIVFVFFVFHPLFKVEGAGGAQRQNPIQKWQKL
tara:strand:+ start:78 stop:362 length:285 start_codon:yes stop_codon:yes gene_type:complete